MRKGLTLLELVITMVIMGVVMGSIPQILNLMNRSNLELVKSQAVVDSLVHLREILSYPWDKKNNQFKKIDNNDQDKSIGTAGESILYTDGTNAQHEKPCNPYGNALPLRHGGFYYAKKINNQIEKIDGADPYSGRHFAACVTNEEEAKLKGIYASSIPSSPPNDKYGIEDFNNAKVGTTLVSCGGKSVEIISEISYQDPEFHPANPREDIKRITIQAKGDYKNENICVFLDYFSFNIGYVKIKEKAWN